MDQARKLAGDLLTKITKEGAYSGAELDQALFNAKLTQQDKAFITELVYGTLARLYSIDRILETYSKVRLSKMEDQVLSQLRLAVYQMKFLDRVPPFAAVSEAVTIVRKKSPKAAGFVNGMLRSILREEKAVAFAGETDRLAFEYSLKPELVRHFQKTFGDRAPSILADLIQAEGLCIRVNQKKIASPDYTARLQEVGLEARPGWFSDQFLYLTRQGALRDLPGYRAGLFSVQNEAAALPPMLLHQLVPDGTILDLCAAPGGKSAYLAETPGDYRITAFDLSRRKLDRMEENYKRLGLTVTTRIGDATEFQPDLAESADGILLDVPCSGLGLLGRKPDIRHNMDQKGMQELAKIQARILRNGSRYLKRGGCLIYSTCTLNPAENQDNVRAFLADHPEFALQAQPLERLAEQAGARGLDNLLLHDGMLTVLPGAGLDGFFVAVLKKN